jgi:hypothetical protein
MNVVLPPNWGIAGTSTSKDIEVQCWHAVLCGTKALVTEMPIQRLVLLFALEL